MVAASRGMSFPKKAKPPGYQPDGFKTDAKNIGALARLRVFMPECGPHLKF